MLARLIVLLVLIASLCFVAVADAAGPGGGGMVGGGMAGGGMGGGGMGGGGMGGMSSEAMLGHHLFMDTNLSEPSGQSCQSCHSPMAGFAEPRHTAVSEGVISGRFGGRNSPTAAYASFSPTFKYVSGVGYVGGQFWDGRAATLADQAKGPFLNSVEMNNPSASTVVRDVQKAMYANMFLSVYGSRAFRNVDTAYNNIAKAIAAFESSSQVNRFNSKYDLSRKGQATLTEQEARGLDLFKGKGTCSSCHSLATLPGAAGPVFTDFTYHNLGVPKNLSLAGNPTDFGLGGPGGGAPNVVSEQGKFKVPTLRNVAVTGPYTHNGGFATLEQVVAFHNQRSGVPEVSANLENSTNASGKVGNLGLSSAESAALVAFLNTLTDSMGGMMMR